MNSYGNIQLINNSDKDSGNTLQLSSLATGKNQKSTVSECIITTILKRKEYGVLGSINIIQGYNETKKPKRYAKFHYI